MSNAALALLKGGSATPPTEPEKEATAVVPETADTEDDELDIDLDAMKTHKDIDALMDTLESEYDIERPDDWKKLTKDAKKEFIASQCEDEDEAEAETPAEAAAEEPAAEAPKEEAKAEAAETPAEDDTGADDAKELGASISKKAEKPAKETKAKATKKADAKAVDDETASFESTVKEIENMSKAQALSAATNLNDMSNLTLFRLGGVLARIQENEWFEPYGNFAEYTEAVHGIAKRKAQYWVAIYKHTVNSNVPWSKIAHVPWSKLKEFVSVMTPDNVDEWVKLANQNTVNDLIEHVKAFKKQQEAASAGEPGSEGDEGVSPVKKTFTKSFKLFEDQVETVDTAIDQIKKDSGISDNHVALEHLCLSYLGKPAAKTEAKNPLDFEGMDFEDVINAVAKQFPDYNIEVG